MTPITATAREQVKTLLAILNAKKLSPQRRKAAEDAIGIWIERAHKAGAPSLGAWMDGPTATASPRHMSVEAYKRAHGAV